MSSDSPATSIQQLIDTCREQWANRGEGMLYLLWQPLEGKDIKAFTSPDALYESGREYVTSLCLTADNDKPCNGAVILPLMPMRGSESEMYHRYPHEIGYFDYISSTAGALLISHCRDTLEPYLLSEGANQGDPRAWWIAYLFHTASVTPDATQLSEICFKDVTKRTLLALEQFQSERLEKALPFDGYLFIPKAEYVELVGLSDKTVKEKAQQRKLPVHPSSLEPDNNEKGYWVEQQSVIVLQQLKNEKDKNRKINEGMNRS
jgi:hypothetical protein